MRILVLFLSMVLLLGCSPAHVYELCERSELPHFRDSSNSIRFVCETVGLVLRSKRSTTTEF